MIVDEAMTATSSKSAVIAKISHLLALPPISLEGKGGPKIGRQPAAGGEHL